MAPQQAATNEATEMLLGAERVSPAPPASTDDLLCGRPPTLDLFRRGDAATLAQVYWAHVDRVEKIIRGSLVAARAVRGRGLVPSRDVEDLVQDTFARAFSPRARLAYDGERHYWPYLSAIARNVLVDALRAVRGDVLVDMNGYLQEGTDDEHLEQNDTWAEPRVMAIVKAYIQRLSPEMAGVHHQRYVLGQSQELAAKALNLTRQRIRTLEGKLRSGLTRELKRAGISTEARPRG
jgi:RNA polymerase sigma-70 factor (ECF subfamily)